MANSGDTSQAAEHWRRTKSLMWLTLALWFFFGYFVHLFTASLNKIVIFGFPLGWYMGAQGSLIAFLIDLVRQTAKPDRSRMRHGGRLRRRT